MEIKKENNSFDEIIDFDDEYCENDNYEDGQTPDDLDKAKYNINKEDQVQMTPEDEDQKDNKYEEDNIIYDPKVKELNEIDIKDKKAIIDFLMNDDLIIKKSLNNEEAIKEKNKNKYSYIKPTLITKINPNMEQPQEKKTAYAKFDLNIDTKEGSPELVKDMNVAAHLLKDQIVEENQDVAKLLFDDINKAKSTKKVLTGKEIGEKIQKTLENKKKNLQRIQDELYEQQNNQITFKPQINHRKKDGTKRDLTSFLKSQQDFLQSVEQKKKALIIKNEVAMKELIVGKPQLNKKSEKMVEKNSTSDPAYLRLYNKREQNKEKIKELSEKLILEQKGEEQKRKEKENELKNNNPYKHIKSKLNINQTNQIGLPQNNKSNSPPKLNRGKSAINISKNNNLNEMNTKKKFYLKDIKSNKI